jgi:hypothetical protein
MIEEWLSEHEEKLKIASLVVACLVLFITVYRWILQKWRADVSLRKYAYFQPLPSKEVRVKEALVIEVPLAQDLTLKLAKADTIVHVLYDGMAEVGDLELELDMTPYEKGAYELTMITQDQTTIKGITWSGRD